MCQGKTLEQMSFMAPSSAWWKWKRHKWIWCSSRGVHGSGVGWRVVSSHTHFMDKEKVILRKNDFSYNYIIDYIGSSRVVGFVCVCLCVSCFVLFCFVGLYPGVTQGLFLDQCSGVAPGVSPGTLHGAKDQTRVGCIA